MHSINFLTVHTYPDGIYSAFVCTYTNMCVLICVSSLWDAYIDRDSMYRSIVSINAHIGVLLIDQLLTQYIWGGMTLYLNLTSLQYMFLEMQKHSNMSRHSGVSGTLRENSMLEMTFGKQFFFQYSETLNIPNNTEHFETLNFWKTWTFGSPWEIFSPTKLSKLSEPLRQGSDDISRLADATQRWYNLVLRGAPEQGSAKKVVKQMVLSNVKWSYLAINIIVIRYLWLLTGY